MAALSVLEQPDHACSEPSKRFALKRGYSTSAVAVAEATASCDLAA